MNMQSNSPRFSSLQLQQGLFALLAVLTTLIGAQLFHQWELRQQASQLSQFVRTSTVHAMPLGATVAGNGVQRATQAMPEVQPRGEVRWIF